LLRCNTPTEVHSSAKDAALATKALDLGKDGLEKNVALGTHVSEGRRNEDADISIRVNSSRAKLQKGDILSQWRNLGDSKTTTNEAEMLELMAVS
jgi:hypothetical protein